MPLTEQQRDNIVAILTSGADLPPEYQHLLFPPERQECELIYTGKRQVGDILSDAMLVPLRPIRTFGEANGGWHNKLILGENLQALQTLRKMKEEGHLANADGTHGVRLVYIDPPFGTGDEYGPTNGEMAYSAKIRGTRLVEFLRQRLVLLKEILASNGSIYVRLDYHFGHYIKVVMDEVFGIEHFQNEIVINRFKRNLRNLTRFNVSTDSLYLYALPGAPFNEQIRTRLCSFCGQEKEPEWHPMVSPGLRNPPERQICGRLMHPPRGGHFKYRQEKIDAMEAEGRIRIDERVAYTNITGERVRGMPEFLQTEEVVVDSDWTDIRGYVLSSRYPTENPEELLARVIEASSDPGDIVLDAFAGSGTTLAVAEKLGRRWVGIDSGKLAICTMQKRLLSLREKIGNRGRRIEPKPFTLYNAGLYDFTHVRYRPWEEWRSLSLNLFECEDHPHSICGVRFDGYCNGSDVLVFDHTPSDSVLLDYGYIRNLDARAGSRVGDTVFIIAPAASVPFFEDYIDTGATRYYILRIPYSITHRLHSTDLGSLQSANVTRVEAPPDAASFDFIRTPIVTCEYLMDRRAGLLAGNAVIRIKLFRSNAKGADGRANLETLAMVLVDYDYPYDPNRPGLQPPFHLDAFFHGNDIRASGCEIRLPAEKLGTHLMLIYIDTYGNELTEIKSRSDFAEAPLDEMGS